MLGIDLVESRESKQPATLLANRVKEACKCRQRVLIAIEGPHSNVIKIKPPIVFSKQDADRYLAALRQVSPLMPTLHSPAMALDFLCLSSFWPLARVWVRKRNWENVVWMSNSWLTMGVKDQRFEACLIEGKRMPIGVRPSNSRQWFN